MVTVGSESVLLPSSGERPGMLLKSCNRTNPWSSPGQNAGVGSLSLLQGIFLTQELNPGLLHCRWFLNQLNHKGSPQGKNTQVGSLSLLQWNFPTQESNWGLLPCKELPCPQMSVVGRLRNCVPDNLMVLNTIHMLAIPEFLSIPDSYT